MVFFKITTISFMFLKGAQDLRLVNGWNRCVGRVEVWHEGAWGTVCDDHFTMNNAHVVCRQLGCGEGKTVFGWSYFGNGSGDIALDQVNCTGSEDYLWDCSHAEWYVNDCGHNEDVSILCSGNISPFAFKSCRALGTANKSLMY